jgi:hypothetical protein
MDSPLWPFPKELPTQPLTPVVPDYEDLEAEVGEALW